MTNTTNETSTTETEIGAYELPEDQVNRAFIEFTTEDGNGNLHIYGDSFVGERIPALLAYTATQLIPQDSQDIEGVLAEYEGKPWRLVIEHTEGEEDGEGDWEPEDTWTVSRAEDEEDQKILGPVLTFLAYLIENEGIAEDIRQASETAE